MIDWKLRSPFPIPIPTPTDDVAEALDPALWTQRMVSLLETEPTREIVLQVVSAKAGGRLVFTLKSVESNRLAQFSISRVLVGP